MSGAFIGTVQFIYPGSPGSQSKYKVFVYSSKVLEAAQLSIPLCFHSQYLPAEIDNLFIQLLKIFVVFIFIERTFFIYRKKIR